jgi:hypothetical protein
MLAAIRRLVGGGEGRLLKGYHRPPQSLDLDLDLDLDDSDPLELSVRNPTVSSSNRAHQYQLVPQMEKQFDGLEAAAAVADSNGGSGSDIGSIDVEWTAEEEKALVRK